MGGKRVNTYIAKKCDTAPNWNEIPVVELEQTYLQTPEEIRAYAQLAWSEDTLWLHMSIKVSHIRAQEEGALGMPCRDSCLEFFFCPVPGDNRYFNIEFNFNGCMFLGFGAGLTDSVRLQPREGTAVFVPEIRRTDDGWELFYRISGSFIRRLVPDARICPQTIRGNFYACSDLSEPSYYLSWNPVYREGFTFHRSECFGQIRLEA